ncbi:MAG TPA: guanylate kinase [Pyrinomonadaceae bacterium]|jgi:guanylate kinase|nr:guanylate kinase [Pyrinomonadaceae bacterium]
MSSEIAGSGFQNKLATETTAGRGILFVVSSPSGGGKGTLIQRILKKVPNLSYSVSFTTRAPRNGEENGREYFFVTPEKFEEMVAANEFLEWARVHSKLYGTARQQVEREISAGRDIILEVDVQGAANVRALMADSVSIFILPPSFEILRQRLKARGTDSPEELDLRLRNAPTELKDYSAFEYVILNDDVDRATNQMAAIVHAERARLSRQESQVKRVVEAFTADEMPDSQAG